MMAMEGPAMCPPEVIRNSGHIQHELTYASPGARQYDLEIRLGQPEKRQQTFLKDGRRVEILLYRTNHQACAIAANDVPNLTPVVFVEKTFVGSGSQFVTTELQPHLKPTPNY